MNDLNKKELSKEELSKLSSDELFALHKNNKSATMRYLLSTKFFTTSEIAKMLNVRYQFVNNVKNEVVRTSK